MRLALVRGVEGGEVRRGEEQVLQILLRSGPGLKSTWGSVSPKVANAWYI